MSLDSPSKKRKLTNGKYTVILSSIPATDLGPIVANFPSIEPPLDTPFQCYHVNKKSAESHTEVEFAEQDIIVAGEGQRVEFVTTDVPTDHGSGTRYLVGVLSKASKTITIRDTPFHIIRRDVKRLKSLAPIASTQSSERISQRSKLGEAFGTKKAIKAIKARERNQVDVTKMEGILGIIGDGVENRTGGLPTEEQAKEIVDISRPIPPHDPNATTLEDVYALSTLIPDAELKGIKVSSILAADDDSARLRLLPYSRSAYINTRIQDMRLGSRSGQSVTASIRRKMQILVYMSSLFAIRTMRHKISDRKAVDERLKGLPSIAIEGILKRFTETPRGTTKATMTSEKETLILTNLMAISLHIDNFVVDPTLIAKDLSMSSAKVNQLFKALGCRIEVSNSTDCARLGTSLQVLGDTKRAILRIPLQFPKERSGKKRKR